MRSPFVLPAAVVLSAALAACGSVATPQGVSEATIDPAIQGQERQLMQNVMANLPATDRDNVIFIDDNLKIHANKPELLSVLIPMKRVSDSTFVAPNGQKLQFAACDVIPERGVQALSANYSCVAEANASYRRVASKDGYSYAKSTLSLPGPGLNTLHAGTNVYAMMGGRSSSNYEVDAGLTYSPTNNWWTNFIRLNGAITYCFENTCSTSSTANRVKPGSVTMEFYVPATNQVALRTTNSSAGSPDYTIVVSAANSNWTPGGTLQRVKRTTSMTGATSGDLIKNISWSGSTLGTSSSTAHTWTSSDVQNDANWSCKTGNVTVRYTDQSTESIDLAYP